MWSPKTPLKLPGKHSEKKYEHVNLQYLYSHTEEESTEPLNINCNNTSEASNASEKIVDFDSEEDTVFVASDAIAESRAAVSKLS
jgi:hypothetical protein